MCIEPHLPSCCCYVATSSLSAVARRSARDKSSLSGRRMTLLSRDRAACLPSLCSARDQYWFEFGLSLTTLDHFLTNIGLLLTILISFLTNIGLLLKKKDLKAFN